MARRNDCHLPCDIHKAHIPYLSSPGSLAAIVVVSRSVSRIQPPGGCPYEQSLSLEKKDFFLFSRISRKEMFSQRFSPTTGKMEWVVEDEDYDMRDEIAR